MYADRDAVPDEIAALKEAVAIERAKGLEIAAEPAVARAKAAEDEALIAQQKLQIAKLRYQIFRQRSERGMALVTAGRAREAYAIRCKAALASEHYDRNSA